MDSGDGAGSDSPAMREPDALEMWFARQRRKWWKQWRWVFYAALVLLAVWLLLETTFFIWVANEWHLSSAQPPNWWAYVEYIVFDRSWTTYVWISLPYLLLGIALLLGTSASKAVSLTPEMAIAHRTERIFQALCKYVRRQLWLFIGILYFCPGLILGITFVEVVYGSPAQSDFWMISLNKAIAITAVSFLAIEGQASVLRRTAASASFTWILLVPFLIALLANYTSNSLDTVVRQYSLEIIPRFSIQMGFWLCVLAVGVSFAFLWRKPPPGFIGTAE